MVAQADATVTAHEDEQNLNNFEAMGWAALLRI